MDFKPNEFFLGLVDFIAILLPGCLLAGIFLMAEAQTPILKEPLYCIGLKDGVTVFFGIGYLFTGYTLGYFLSSVASILDTLFDEIRKQIYPFKEHLMAQYLDDRDIDAKNPINQQIIQSIKDNIKKGDTKDAETFNNYCEIFLANKLRKLFHFFFEVEWNIKMDRSLEKIVCFKELVLPKMNDPNAYQWSILILDTYYPAAAQNVNRTMAASKFFRSLVPVFLLCFLFQWVQWIPDSISIWAWSGLALLSFREYVVQRQKSIQAAYRGMITFYHLPDKFKKDVK